MNSSRANIAAARVFFRPSRRVWVNTTGRIIAPAEQPKEPTATQSVDWEIYVADTANDQKIEGYPTLSGTDTVSAESDKADTDLQLVYLDKLRFADTPVDIKTLKDKRNAGIWHLNVRIIEPTPPVHH